ncbi:hypothetical protein [Halomonas sp. ML-15]|uniref:hypothetical protein n=1 Tax=Halomonas sp. ML-15 TaxID=2773305 RepID=UPI002964D55F|nr:hypothetical protein [Halomonas sp. ML-15]
MEQLAFLHGAPQAPLEQMSVLHPVRFQDFAYLGISALHLRGGEHHTWWLTAAWLTQSSSSSGKTGVSCRGFESPQCIQWKLMAIHS